MSADLYTYEVYFSVADSPHVRELVATLASQHQVTVENRHGYAFFDYRGKDPGRGVVAFLVALAEALSDAEGEARCTIDTDGPDPVFEFYRISSGRLMMQTGRIVRSGERVVDSGVIDELSR
jgi:hypothetical protein